MAIFAYRLSRERREISQIKMLGKFAGAVGNYNAHVAAYPEINWPEIAEEFVSSLGLEFNPYVPQVCYTLIVWLDGIIHFVSEFYALVRGRFVAICVRIPTC